MNLKMDEITYTHMSSCKGGRGRGAYETNDNNASNRIRKDETAANIGSGVQVAKSNGENSNVAKVECVGKLPSWLPAIGFYFREHCGPPTQPDKEHHGLKNQCALGVSEGKGIWVMP